MDETERVHAHLTSALAVVSAKGGSRRRRRLIGALREYTEARRYPRNLEHRGEIVPSFIDAAGTRCAMAHLIELHGGEDLVARVARSANHARVRSLANDRDLLSWLATWGLTLDEAARVQPSYCWSSANCVCVNAGVGTKTVLETTVVAGDAGAYVARVDKVHGVTDREAVGDTLPLSYLYNERERPLEGRKVLLVPYVVASGERRFAQKEVDAQGRVACEVFAVRGRPPPVPVPLAIRALLSKNCGATLTAANRAYGDDRCKGVEGNMLEPSLRSTTPESGEDTNEGPRVPGSSLGFTGLLATTAMSALVVVRRRRVRTNEE